MNKKRRRKLHVVFGMSLMIAGMTAAAACGGEIQAKKKVMPKTVSYTHLTLPTIVGV